jgi:thioredoxin 1
MANTTDFVHSVTEENFESRVLQATDPVAVEFMSYGCEHCRLLEPVLQEVADKLGSEETIFRVSIATDQELASRYQIEGTPTIVMFSNGSEVGRAVGPDPSIEGLLAAVTQPFRARI